MDNSLVKLCFSPAFLNRVNTSFGSAIVSNSLQEGCVPGLAAVTISETDGKALLGMLATAFNVRVVEVIPELNQESLVGTTVSFKDNEGNEKCGTLISKEGNTATVKLFDQGEITIQVSIN